MAALAGMPYRACEEEADSRSGSSAATELCFSTPVIRRTEAVQSAAHRLSKERGPPRADAFSPSPGKSSSVTNVWSLSTTRTPTSEPATTPSCRTFPFHGNRFTPLMNHCWTTSMSYPTNTKNSSSLSLPRRTPLDSPCST